MAIKKGDFIEINYTGRLADGEKETFDTTIESVAKKEGIHSPKTTYGSVIVIVGEGHVIPGIDKQIVGKDIGKHTFHIEDVDAFGKKNAKLLRLIPAKIFSRDNVKPFPGLQVNVDGQIGIVRTVSGGRIIVDFNHPLSSKDVEYDVEVIRIVKDKKEQIESIFKLMGVPIERVEADDKKATIFTKTLLPQQLTEPLTKDLIRLTGLEEITFEATGKKAEKASKPAPKQDKEPKKTE